MAKTPEEAKTAAVSGDAPVVKRGRGRPPKDGVAKKKAYVPSGKPRGRPPTGKAKKPAYVPTGKPRGRPKGSGKAATTTDTTPKKLAGATRRGGPTASAIATPASEGSLGRGRRSRASEVAAEQETPGATQRRGRGRPRKSTVDAAAEEQLAQEDQQAKTEDAEEEEDADGDADMDADADADADEGDVDAE